MKNKLLDEMCNRFIEEDFINRFKNEFKKKYTNEKKLKFIINFKAIQICFIKNSYIYLNFLLQFLVIFINVIIQ